MHRRLQPGKGSMKILVADPVAKEGIESLKKAGAQVDVKTGMKPAELLSVIGDYDGLIVRSETKVTAEVISAGKKLQVVGRAGVGVDNIDAKEATKRGIVVVNAPTSNTVSAAEHTIALMLSLARHVPKANVVLKSGQWQRNQFMGVELRGKTLGIIGLGKVGSEVARRAKGFDMRLLGHDPFVSADYAKMLGVELAPLETIYKESDFLTVHTPLTAGTKSLIGAKELATMKPNVRLINVARGGIIDEQALYDAVEAGKVAGAAIDVFTEEPALSNILLKSEKIIVTPHLGASTQEAQANVSLEVADQVLAVLQGKPARYAVNAPMVLPDALSVLAPFVQVANVAGKMATQLSSGQTQSITIRYEGDIANYDSAYLRAAVIGGLLAPISEERVNVVNAALVATSRGMKILEQKGTASEHYKNLLTVELTTSAGTTVVAGTSMWGQTRIVRVNDYWLDVTASNGYMLIIENKDRPGVIGAVGTMAGKSDVNISFMEVGRLAARGKAMMVIGLDEPMPESALKAILALPDMYSARLVKL